MVLGSGVAPQVRNDDASLYSQHLGGGRKIKITLSYIMSWEPAWTT